MLEGFRLLDDRKQPAGIPKVTMIQFVQCLTLIIIVLKTAVSMNYQRRRLQQEILTNKTIRDNQPTGALAFGKKAQTCLSSRRPIHALHAPTHVLTHACTHPRIFPFYCSCRTAINFFLILFYVNQTVLRIWTIQPSL